MVEVTSYNDFLKLKQYSHNTISVYLSLKKHLSDAPNQSEVNNFLMNHQYKSASAFLKSYVWDYLHQHKSIDIFKISGRSKRLINLERVLTDDEYELLISRLPLRLSLMCRFLKEAAMRMSEMLNIGFDGSLNYDDINNIIGLEWTDIDNNNNYIDFIEGKIVWFGKGRKQCMGWLSTETIRLLRKYIIDSKYDDKSKSLFLIKRSCFHKHLMTYSIKFINKKVTSHWFKRTCGRWLEDKGFALEERQQYLHHSDSRTTQESYSFKKGTQVFNKVKGLIR